MQPNTPFAQAKGYSLSLSSIYSNLSFHKLKSSLAENLLEGLQSPHTLDITINFVWNINDGLPTP